jgi:hypothetical protein
VPEIRRSFEYPAQCLRSCIDRAGAELTFKPFLTHYVGDGRSVWIFRVFLPKFSILLRAFS